MNDYDTILDRALGWLVAAAIGAAVALVLASSYSQVGHDAQRRDAVEATMIAYQLGAEHEAREQLRQADALAREREWAEIMSDQRRYVCPLDHGCRDDAPDTEPVRFGFGAGAPAGAR